MHKLGSADSKSTSLLYCIVPCRVKIEQKQQLLDILIYYLTIIVK